MASEELLARLLAPGFVPYNQGLPPSCRLDPTSIEPLRAAIASGEAATNPSWARSVFLAPSAAMAVRSYLTSDPDGSLGNELVLTFQGIDGFRHREEDIFAVVETT